MSKLLLFLVLLGLWTHMACKTPVAIDTTTPQKRSAKFLLRQLEDQQLQYDWFGCRAKIKVDSEERDAVFTAAVRLKKDSLIWVRIRKMSVEGARIQITPEYIEILNRQEGQYIKRPFSFIKEEYGLDITFHQLQEVLLGNPILYQDRTLLSSVSGKRLLLETPPNQEQVLKLFLNSSSFLLEELRGSMKGSSLSIVYSDYEALGKQQVAQKKVLTIDSKGTGQVNLEMEFSGMELDEAQKVSFTVPASYERL